MMQEAAWNASLQYGVLGIVCCVSVTMLVWFVVSQKKELNETIKANREMYQTVIKDNLEAKITQTAATIAQSHALVKLSDSIDRLPCRDGLPCGKWDNDLLQSASKSHAHNTALASGVRK